MEKLGAFEKDILFSYEKGELQSTSPSKVDLVKFKTGESTSGYPHLI